MKQKQTKQTIGHLIKYYRMQLLNETKELRYRQKDIIKIKGPQYQKRCLHCLKKCGHESICSNRVLSAIESGEVINNDCIYFGLAENIGKRYEMSRKLRAFFERLKIDVQLMIEWGNYSEMNKLLIELKEHEAQCRRVLYYEELYEIFFWVITYYSDRYVPMIETALKFEEIYPYFDQEVQSMILVVLYYFYQYTRINEEKTKSILLLSESFDVDNAYVFELKLQYHIKEKQYFSAFQLLQKIANLTFYHRNIWIQLYYYQSMIKIMPFIDKEQSLFYAQKGLDLLDEYPNRFSFRKQAIYKTEVGCIYFYQKDYLKSYQVFQECLQLDASILLLIIPIIFLASVRAKASSDDLEQLINYYHRFSYCILDGQFVIIKYFEKKLMNSNLSLNDAYELEDLLVEEILPNIDANDLLYRYYVNELKQINQITNRVIHLKTPILGPRKYT